MDSKNSNVIPFPASTRRKRVLADDVFKALSLTQA
jgi:hypothetical protein